MRAMAHRDLELVRQIHSQPLQQRILPTCFGAYQVQNDVPLRCCHLGLSSRGRGLLYWRSVLEGLLVLEGWVRGVDSWG